MLSPVKAVNHCSKYLVIPRGIKQPYPFPFGGSEEKYSIGRGEAIDMDVTRYWMKGSTYCQNMETNLSSGRSSNKDRFGMLSGEIQMLLR